MRGNLYSLEGISGTGKTYYRKKLEEVINNDGNTILIKEIFDEAQKGLGQKIFSALYHTKDRFFNMGLPYTETMLLLARSMYKYESTIKGLIDSGKTVIEDRSIDTIALYQAILIAQKYGGNPMEIAENIYSFVKVFRPLPEKTFLLYGNPDLSIKRAEERDGKPYKPEEVKLLNAVDKFYQIYADKHPERFVKLNIQELSPEQIIKKMQDVINSKDIDQRGE